MDCQQAILRRGGSQTGLTHHLDVSRKEAKLKGGNELMRTIGNREHVSRTRINWRKELQEGKEIAKIETTLQGGAFGFKADVYHYRMLQSLRGSFHTHGMRLRIISDVDANELVIWIERIKGARLVPFKETKLEAVQQKRTLREKAG